MTGSAFDFEEALRAQIIDRPRRTAIHSVVDEITRPKFRASGARAYASRTVEHRRKYAGDPWGYFFDVLGATLTKQQDEVLELLEASTRVLVPSANNQGKTFLAAGYGVYIFDAVAALPDEENGLEEQGARIILPGPDHDTVFETIYSEMLTHAARAESRGFLMPGERSDRSVLWRVRAKWNVEVLSPPNKVGQNVSHTASGRHHRNQIAIIEEGQGVGEPLWLASEGMCSSHGNKIFSPFNPTEPTGAAYQRSRNGSYRVYVMDAFKHPNVLERKPVIPDAVDFAVIDTRVRTDCRDRGPYPGPPIEPEFGDFVYALPPLNGDGVAIPERGGRKDGIPGHRDGTPRVYRPSGAFQAQIRGQWPSSSDTGLFDAASWDAGVQRWKAGADPQKTPTRVGCDPARRGGDEIVGVPAWGENADALLRAFALAEQTGPKAVERLRETRRIRSGLPEVFPKGDGVDVAERYHARWPDSPLVVDEGGVGASPYDHLNRVLKHDVVAVAFSETPLERVPGEPYADNMRVQLYVRAAMLVARGLVDPPDDAQLREEVLATDLLPGAGKIIEEFDATKKRLAKRRVQTVRLPEKDDIKKRIGRSPDRADAWVLSLFQPPPAKQRDYDFSSIPPIQR